MGTVSLIGIDLAKKGLRFVFIGPIKDAECQKCRCRSICFNLEEGALYEITEVREVTHNCPIHDCDRVRVVEVEKIPLETALPTRLVHEGSTITLSKNDIRSDCPRSCQHYRVCHAPGFLADGTFRIKQVGQTIPDCPVGGKMVNVILEEVK